MFLGQAAVDKATEASNNPDLEAVREKGQGWLDANSDDIDADGNFIGVLTESQITTANDINEARLEDLEAIADYTGEDIYTQKANELSTIITTIGNYGTTDGDDSDTVDSEETEESVIQEYYEVFGEELVNDVINKTGDLIDQAQQAGDDPLGAIKNILDNIMPVAKDCPSWTDPCTSASGGGTVAGGGNPCWKDCVEVGLIFGIPGLPMPPGFMGKTVRDLDNAVKAIGKDIEDFLEDPTGIFDEIGQAVESVGKTIDDFIDDPAGTIGEIIEDIQGQITDVFLRVLILKASTIG